MNYYYLISSLPKLDVTDDSLSADQLDEIIELITRNLSDDDLVIMNCLLHENDNQNLLSVLFREYHDFDIRTTHQPSSFPIEVLDNYRREFSALPDYLMNYLNDLSGTFSSLTMREMEQTLNRYFLEYIQGIDHPFLNTYYSWTFRLKQAIAEANLKSFDSLKTKNEASEPSFPATRTLHDLTEPQEITSQMQPIIESKDLEAIERKVDQYYWQFSGSWQDPFSTDQVLAYMVKLQRLYCRRRIVSKGEADRFHFGTLVAELKEKRSSPKIPIV
ncbi:MAG: DUF2764 family protein [Marinoscillum sp.]